MSGMLLQAQMVFSTVSHRISQIFLLIYLDNGHWSKVKASKKSNYSPLKI